MATQAAPGSVRSPAGEHARHRDRHQQAPDVGVGDDRAAPRWPGPDQPGTRLTPATASMTPASMSRIQTGVSTAPGSFLAGLPGASPPSRPAPAGRAAAGSWGRSLPRRGSSQRLPDQPHQAPTTRASTRAARAARPGSQTPAPTITQDAASAIDTARPWLPTTAAAPFSIPASQPWLAGRLTGEQVVQRPRGPVRRLQREPGQAQPQHQPQHAGGPRAYRPGGGERRRFSIAGLARSAGHSSTATSA